MFHLRLQKTFLKRLQGVLIKMNILALLIPPQMTSSRRLQGVLIKISIFVLVIRLQDVLLGRLQNVFKTSSRRLAKMCSRHLQDVLQRCISASYTILVNMFSRCLQDVFTTFLRHTAKTVIYTERFASVTLLRNYGHCSKFARVATVSQVLVFHFTTPFSGCLQKRI